MNAVSDLKWHRDEATRLASKGEEQVTHVYGTSEAGIAYARLAQVHATLAAVPDAGVRIAAQALLDVLDGHQWNTPPDVDDARKALRIALAGAP